MTEWAFLGLQERKKALLGKAYELRSILTDGSISEAVPAYGT